ncbi:MAG: PilZ domain-containing protein, partial [Nitrospiraceae bacterium]
VINISENGLFLKSQHIRFPLYIEFDVSIPLNEEMVNIPVKVRRITKSNGYYDGIGVELLKRPHNYLKYLNRLRLALKNRKTPSNGNS